MKWILLLLPVIFAYNIVEEVNQSNTTWVAKMNYRKRSPLIKINFKPTKKLQSIVKNWDSRIAYDCESLKQIRDQGYCGSCWAVSLASVLSDGLCVNRNQTIILSPQFLVSCDTDNFGCDGGYLDLAWNFTKKVGIVSDSCMPYQSYHGDVPKCVERCVNRENWTLYQTISFQQFEWVLDAQLHIMKHGSIQAGMEVYEDFFYYSSGIYKHTSGDYKGDHAISLLGWGNLNGQDYWIAKNSWGTEWGMDGFFYIQRGTNECQIESSLFGGLI